MGKWVSKGRFSDEICLFFYHFELSLQMGNADEQND